MAFDPHANFGYSTIATAPAPALTGLSLTVAAGQGALFPAAPFNCTVWPSGVTPVASNAEIIRVTVVAGDTFTIVRAQEGTAAIAIAAGYQISNSISVKVITDLENAITALPTFAVQSISAGAAAATGPMVVFSNSNNITFGVVGNTVTASFLGAGGGGAAISAGTQSQNTGTIIFSNSNGITWGLDAGTLTASYTVPTQSTQPVAFSAGGASSVFSTLMFRDANGASWTNNAGSVELGYSVPSTAGLISRVNFSGGTTSNNLSAITFGNANGVSFGLNAGTMTASVAGQSTQPVAASATNGSFLFSTLGFSNANGVTFGTSAGGIITASVAAAGGAQTGISGIQVSNTTYTSGTVTFQNANGISFGSSGANGISASYTVPTVTNSSWSVSDSATSGTVGRLAFTNLNGVTLSLSTGAGGSHTIVGSHNGLTSQSNQQITAGNGGFAFQTLSFSNANNVSFSTSAGSAIVASVTVASTQASINFSAGTTSNNSSAIVFSNGNGVTFGLNAGTITASVAAGGGGITNINISAGTTSNNLSAFTFSDAGGVSFGLNGSVITANVTAAPAPVNFSAGGASGDLGSVVFSNSNGMSFGLNGSTITGDFAWSVSAAGSSNAVDQLVFSNANGIVFGLTGSTITASANAAAGPIVSMTENFHLQGGSTAFSSLSQNMIYFDKFELPVNLTFDSVRQLVSVNVIASTSAAATSATMGHTMQMMCYTRSVTDPGATNFSLSNNLVSMWSNQVTFSGAVSASSSSITWNAGWQTNSTGGSVSVSLNSVGAFQNPIYTGLKVIPFFQGTSMTPGAYWIAFRQSSSTSGANFASSLMRFSHVIDQIMTNGSWGSGFGASFSSSVLPIPGVGIYSVTSGAFPTSLQFSNLSNQSLNRRYYVFNA